MKPDTQLVLGDFAFERFEIPEDIDFGGSQIVATHKLVGGKRVLQPMGRDDSDLSWSGLLIGDAALDRARYLDYLRVQGKPLLLAWSELNYQVVITNFKCSFQRFYKLPYTITCEVSQDNTQPNPTYFPSGFDESMTDDNASAQSLGVGIGDSALSSLLSGLNAAISTVSSFANAAQSVISSVLTPLAAVQSRVDLLITATANTAANVSTFGGVLPGNPISQSIANATSQTNALNRLPQLYNLQSVLRRMNGNLGLINTAPNAKTVTISGGNLYQVAAQHYGDATKWTAIARANGMTDPQLSGINTLVIPPNPSASGGVYGA